MRDLNYEKRMESSMNYKIEAIKPWLKEGVKVLDYGCGRSNTIRDLVQDCKGSYYLGIDNDFDEIPQGFTHLDKLGRATFQAKYLQELDESIEEEFDVIFMSSVIHEMQSFMTRDQFVEEIKKLCGLLKVGGHLIVRDWDICRYDGYKEGKLIPRDKTRSLYPVLELWKDCFYWSGIKMPIYFKESLGGIVECIEGTKSDLLNFAYHVVWGTDSISRETDEDYRVNYSWAMYSCYMDCINIYEEHDEGYKKYLSEYFENYEEIFSWAPTKKVTVWEKV